MRLAHLPHTLCHYTAAPEPIFFPGEFGPEMDDTLDRVRARVARHREKLGAVSDDDSPRATLASSFGLLDVGTNNYGITTDPSSGFASGGGDFGGAGGGSDW